VGNKEESVGSLMGKRQLFAIPGDDGNDQYPGRDRQYVTLQARSRYSPLVAHQRKYLPHGLGFGIPSMSDLEKGVEWIEKKTGINVKSEGERRAMAEYLKRIGSVKSWVRAKGEYLGCEIAQGIEEEIPSIRFGTQASSCPKAKAPKKPSNTQRLGMMMAQPLISEFEAGMKETMAPALKARLIPYFIILPVAGFFIGKWWGGRR